MKVSHKVFLVLGAVGSLAISGVALGWATYPGAVCVPESDAIEHGVVDGVMANLGSTTATFHCPLVTHQDKYWNGSLNLERYSPGDRASNDDLYVTVHDGNNNATNSSISCRPELHYYGSANETEYGDPLTTSTTGTGRSTLSWDMDGEFTATEWFYHYIIKCTLPPTDTVMMEETASAVVAVRARYDIP